MKSTLEMFGMAFIFIISLNVLALIALIIGWILTYPSTLKNKYLNK